MRAPSYSFPSDDEIRGRKVVVLGLGLYHGGAAVCRFLHRLGCEIVVTDLRDAITLESSLREIEGIPCELALGGHRSSDLDSAAFVVVNPAIPANAPFLLEAIARGIPLISEVGLFFSRLLARFVLITGSKGKTTTTSLLHSMAYRHDSRTIVGGNIGTPLLDRVHAIEPDATVIFEISSFQLEQLRGLSRRPDVAILTNVFPVHIDRHGTFQDYREAKREVLEGAKCAVLNADDLESRSLGEAFQGRKVYFSTSSGGEVPRETYRFLGDTLVAADGATLLRRMDLRVPGLHNVANVLAAFAAADLLGIPREASRDAAADFRGVEHRLELVVERDGIRYVNDSIATTPQSAIAALEALAVDGTGVVLIVGGKDSPFDLSKLAEVVVAKAKAVFGIGETGERVVAAIREREAGFPACFVSDLESAMKAARGAARAGDVVVLSPAFPSFDQFKNFKDRGESFKRLARGA